MLCMPDCVSSRKIDTNCRFWIEYMLQREAAADIAGTMNLNVRPTRGSRFASVTSASDAISIAIQSLWFPVHGGSEVSLR